MQIIISSHSMLKTSGGPAFGLAKMCDEFAISGVDVCLVTRQSAENVRPSHPAVKMFEYNRSFLEIADQLPIECAVWYDNGIWHLVNHGISKFAKRNGIPLFVHPRGGLEPWVFNRKPWKKLPAWHLYQRRDLCAATGIVTSSQMEEMNVLKLIDAATYVVPNAIDLDAVSVDLNAVGKNKTVLFLSRIHPKKGIDYLLKAWAQSVTTGWILKIAGTDLDDYEKDYKAMAHSLRLDNVEFCGAVFGEVKRALFKESAIFVLPSHSENFGNVIVEAMAAGAVVITTRNTPWQFIHGNMGWCIDLSVGELRCALEEAMGMSSDARMSIARHAQAHALKNYDWRTHVQRLTAIFHEKIGNP